MKLNIPVDLENFFDKNRDKSEKKIHTQIENIILSSSDGNDLPFFHYTALGIGNLILTYLYAIYIKSNINNSKIISFYPFRIHPLIKNLNYMFNRSSLQLNYNRRHFTRLINYKYLKNATKDIFVKKKNLFLSTDVVNQDDLAFKKIANLDLNLVKEEITSNFNFNYTIKENDFDLINNKEKNISIGLHLRRGDFKKNRSAKDNFNTSPDLDSQLNIIKKIKSKISIINIYSDQSFSNTINELNGELDKFKLNFFSERANGTKVLEEMTKNDVMILCNSTLSTLSCMISNQIGLFDNQIFPSKVQKYFKNIQEIKY